MKNTTGFKDSNNEDICIGDMLDILATNMYSGEVNLVNGVVCLETVFFNKPLVEHMQAEDLQWVMKQSCYEPTETNTDDELPF